MKEKRAREILGEWIEPSDDLYDLHQYLNWEIGDSNATLDGLFNADELEAIAWWMRNTKKEGEEDGQKTT